MGAGPVIAVEYLEPTVEAEALPDEVPDPANPPPGCRFHPRCPYAFERCVAEEPPLITVADGRAAAACPRKIGQES